MPTSTPNLLKVSQKAAEIWRFSFWSLYDARCEEYKNIKRVVQNARPKFGCSPRRPRWTDHYQILQAGSCPGLVETVINKLERGKAADIDGLSAEHLLFCNPIISVVLAKLFELIVQFGYVPNDTENAGLENRGPKNIKGWKMQDWKWRTKCQ